MRLKLALTLVVLVACKKPGAPTTNPDDPVSSPEPDPDAEPAATDPDAPPTCQDGGEVWDGKHEGCLYEVAGCCYDSPEAACAAAGCEEDCQILESAPAQIACPK